MDKERAKTYGLLHQLQHSPILTNMKLLGERTYIFRAYNTESVYGYGTSLEADRYCNFLNTDRDINLYYAEFLDLTPNQLQNTINLADELAEI